MMTLDEAARAARLTFDDSAVSYAQHGDFEIVVRTLYGTLCYTVYRNGVKVPCMTRNQEARFPKRAAAIGTRMVAEARGATQPSLLEVI
jgi:hypothetical protein